MQDIMSVFLLYHKKYVEIIGNYERLMETLEVMKYILNQIFIKILPGGVKNNLQNP
jgi:hypothetical protein